LDGETRAHMVRELEADLAEDNASRGAFYRSKNFNEHGDQAVIELMRAAMERGDCDTLAKDLANPNFYRQFYVDKRGRRRNPLFRAPRQTRR